MYICIVSCNYDFSLSDDIMKTKYFSFFLFFLLAFPSQLLYSIDQYKFRTLSPDGGFYYDGVKAIQQDKNGHTWILMDKDLLKFDGYQYKRYYSAFAKIDSTKEWTLQGFTIAPNGRLLVNTNNGLYFFDEETEHFYYLFDKVDVIKVDNRNNIWVKYNKTWSILNIIDKSLETPLYDGEALSYISNNLCPYNDDLYVFSNFQRVYRFNYTKREFELCLTLPDNDGPIRDTAISQGYAWAFAGGRGVYKIDLSSHTIVDFFEFPQSLARVSILADKNGNLWIGTIEGLYILDPQTRQYTHYAHSETDAFSLPNNSIWCMYEDWQQNIWIGGYAGSLCYVNMSEKNAFKTYTPQMNKLNHIPVSCFAEDSKYYWVGTEGGGINRIDKKTEEFSSLTTKNGLSSNNIKSIVIDKNENLWISMYNGGLNHYDTKTGKIKSLKHGKNDNSLLHNDIRKMIPDGNSGLWIVYQDLKLVISYYSTQEDLFKHYLLDDKSKTGYIFDILKQGDKYIWAISKESIYRLDIEKDVLENINCQGNPLVGLFTFCLDDSGNLWIGTIGNGLIQFNTSSHICKNIEKVLNSNISSIYSISYNDGNIWLGTDNGLYRYNIAKDSLLRFDKRDGTQGQIYYPLANMKTRDGQLLFGGTNGFTIVYPKEISQNTYHPKVIISNFYIDHTATIPNDYQEDDMKAIKLNYDQTNFGFQFSSDNYLIPEKNRFKYRLRGYDDRWMETDASNRTAMYSKVPAGTYYFEVQTANNDGVWGDITVMKIERATAPWFSIQAYVIYLFIILGIVYMIIRYYNEKKNLKMQLYLENVEKEKKEEIHQSQLRFFTNISHDFRTPLSLILAALDRLREEGLKEYYYRILNGNAQRLLNLVNELMDFRTVENGKMKLELQQFNVNRFVNGIAADFEDYAKQRNITFLVKSDTNFPDNVYADKSILEKVVMNLLNNAFKYTSNNGFVKLEIRYGNKEFSSSYQNSFTVGSISPKSDMFSIIVGDSGVGISKESISSVFERFYKVNTVNADSHIGTGIGLALVKSLILLHKGDITIYSERDKGTDFVVRFPLDTSLFRESDFLKIDNSEKMEVQDEISPKEEITIGDPDKLEEDIMLREKKRVLIAEDNEDLRKLISDSLSDTYEVIEAVDGLDASEKVENVDVDLIISDIMMPRKDGVAFCIEIKSNINTSHIPFILLTAKTGVESKIEGKSSGADMYLVKPLDLNYLKISVQNIFKYREQLRAYYAKNYFAESNELTLNEQDNKFLKRVIEYIESNLDQPNMDVNHIASQLSMSRSKLYTKLKSLTGKSIVEFVLNYRLHKAAKLIIEENITMKEVMIRIGIESQPYFTNSFKKEFGETPTAFAAKHRKKK